MPTVRRDLEIIAAAGHLVILRTAPIGDGEAVPGRPDRPDRVAADGDLGQGPIEALAKPLMAAAALGNVVTNSGVGLGLRLPLLVLLASCP